MATETKDNQPQQSITDSEPITDSDITYDKDNSIIKVTMNEFRKINFTRDQIHDFSESGKLFFSNNKDYDIGLNLFSFNDKFFKSNIFSKEIFIIKNIFENFRDNEFQNKLLIEKNILDLDPTYENQKILFLYWFLIQYYQKNSRITFLIIPYPIYFHLSE